jgi:hypothetical protein
VNRLPLLDVALLLALGNIAPADDKPVKGDLAKLQGTWTGRTGRDGDFLSTMTINGFDNRPTEFKNGDRGALVPISDSSALSIVW